MRILVLLVLSLNGMLGMAQNPDSLFVEANEMYRQEKYNEALKAFDTAKDLNPQYPFVWVNKGLGLEKLQEYDLALQAYKKAAIELKFEPATEHLNKLQQILRS